MVYQERSKLTRRPRGNIGESPLQLELFDVVPGFPGCNVIERMVRPGNMLRAYQRVKRNGGAPGVDGLTVDDLESSLTATLANACREIANGTYQPQPVRTVEIPKPGGGSRKLGIPTVLDRVIQQALLQVLTPVFDPEFSKWSFGFRPGRGTHDAIRHARDHIQAGCRWVVDVDLEKFFGAPGKLGASNG